MSYFPTKDELQKMAKANQEENKLEQKHALLQSMPLQFAPGRSQQYGFDKHFIKAMRDMEQRYKDTGNEQFYHMSSRMKSLASLDDNLYKEFCNNPNSLYNWFPKLQQAIKQQDFFKTPKTVVKRLPVELAQFMRLEYADTTETSKKLFNEIIFKLLELEDDKTYFIKTGTFSSKFEFRNAKCSEPREMGEYFQAINEFAMTVGAGMSVDVVAREYIEDVENNPTIYNGMPLHTEFRMFVDFDEDKIIGTAPYWHPIVMKRAFKNSLVADIERDYQVYQQHEDKLRHEYNQHVNRLQKEMKSLIKDIDLSGQYSIDIMKNGDDFYVIDMALMSESALTEFINTESLEKDQNA